MCVTHLRSSVTLPCSTMSTQVFFRSSYSSDFRLMYLTRSRPSMPPDEPELEPEPAGPGPTGYTPSRCFHMTFLTCCESPRW